MRAAERFMTVGTGEAECKGCGYTYDPKNGDPDYPVSKGTQFQVWGSVWKGKGRCMACTDERQGGGAADDYVKRRPNLLA